RRARRAGRHRSRQSSSGRPTHRRPRPTRDRRAEPIVVSLRRSHVGRRGGRTVGRITIVGTGYIGTSLGLALKAQKTGVEVVGHDREYGRAGQAKKLGAVDRAEWNLPAALEGAGMVVVATPLAEIESVFGNIAELLAPGCVVTDTA